MSITFEADSISVDPAGRNGIELTIEVDDFVVAAQLSDDSRLHDLKFDVVLNWLLENGNHDDILEAIGSDKIHEFISHE